MIVNNRITIRDADGDQFAVEVDEDAGGFFLLDEGSTPILGISDEDARALVQFFARYGVSA